MATKAKNIIETDTTAKQLATEVRKDYANPDAITAMLKELQYNREQQNKRDMAFLELVEKMKADVSAQQIVVHGNRPPAKELSDKMQSELRQMTIMGFAYKMPESITN